MEMKGRMVPSPSMAVALLALVVALGGASYAAVKVKKNSVGTKQLKTDAVTNPKIATQAVDKGELASGAVDTGKLADAAVTSVKLDVNSVNSTKVTDGTLTRADHGRGVLLTAYARINNPVGMNNAAVTPGTSVNVIDVDVLPPDADGDLIVSVDPAALPGGSLGTCTVMTQPISLSNAAGLVKLGSAVAVFGGPLGPADAQVQTFNNAGAPAELDFYFMVACPPA
jgi:hypothetical protein